MECYDANAVFCAVKSLFTPENNKAFVKNDGELIESETKRMTHKHAKSYKS